MAKKMVPVAEDELLRNMLAKFSAASAQAWLRGKFDAYDPATGVEELAYLQTTLTKDEKTYFQGVKPLGFIKGLPSKEGLKKPLVVAAIAMDRELSDRTSRAKQFALAKKIIAEAFKTPIAGLGGKEVGLCTQGLFFFHDEVGNFRISLVTCGLKGRRLVSTTAKRQSFFCRPSARNNIVKRQLDPEIKSFENLQKAFSVEGITKEFYNKLFAWYQWACDKKTGVTFPNKIHDSRDDRDKLPEAIIRLITRLMFVWFVRQKGLIPDDLFRRERVEELLNDGFCPDSTRDGTYYRAILQNLFFATLNCPIEDRRFVQSSDSANPQAWARSDFRCTTKYRYKEAFRSEKVKEFLDLMRQVPFLNCALFDCLDRRFDKVLDTDEIERNGGEWEIFTDGFSRRGATGKSPSYQAFVPNALFFYDQPNEEGRQGIISLFDQYEFTVDENTADDADVALDPELLGKVFENLLGAFNPETQEVARKSTGSFYTPREIVDYMTDESLKNYLKTRVPSVPDASLARLFDKNDETDAHVYLKPADLEAILEALYGCRILDPACGSGAFPMGLLHRMTQLFDRLDNNCTSIRRKIRERYESDRKFIAAADWMTDKERAERLADIEDQRQINLHHPDYTRKLFIIENCIYGVDIQPIATQIAKLRFFISLLCDQLRNHRETDARGEVTYHLLALPNLEAKFACANTLISLPKMEGTLDFSTPEITQLRKKLAAQRRRYFFARTYTAKKKAQDEERQTRREIKAAVKKVISTPDQQEIAKQTKILSALESEYEQVREPKWVTVRKPKQGDLFGSGLSQGELELERVDKNAVRRRELEAAMVKARQTITAEQAKSTQAQTGSAGDAYAEQVANWNPYDQNASSPFFDPDWMFGIKDGFDIVIGNPPYGKIFSPEINRIVGEALPRFLDTKDAFVAFVLYSIRILTDGGVLQFIIPSSWHGGPAYLSLREECLSYSLLNVVELPFDMFSSAYVDTGIVGLQKVKPVKGWKVGAYRYSGRDTFDESIRQHIEHIEQALWESVLDKKFILSSSQLALEKKVAEIKGLLGDYVVAKRGVLLEKGSIHDAPTKQCDFPYFVGDVYRYTTRIDSEWIKFGSGFKEGPKSEDWYSGERILLRRLMSRVHRLMANISEETFVTNKNLYIIKSLSRNVRLKMILGIVNSALYSYLYSARVSGSVKDDFPQVTLTDLLKLPLPAVGDDDSKSIVALVTRILDAKKQDPDADTTALEAEIDQLVYKLYDLTPEEIAIVEGKGEKKAGGDERAKPKGRGTKVVAVEAPAAEEIVDDYEELD